MAKASAASTRRLNAQATALPTGGAPAGTRGTLLGAALRLFAERGFSGTSIRDIAAGAGVQSATLYAHYRSKEQILAELIRVAHDEHHRRMRAALLESEPEPRRQLVAYVQAHVRVHAEYPMLCLVANAELYELSAELAAASLALRRQSEELLEDIVRRGVEKGVFDPAHPWLAMAAIGGMGLRVANWYTPEFELPIDEIADVYATFALRIVGTEEEPRARLRHPLPPRDPSKKSSPHNRV